MTRPTPGRPRVRAGIALLALGVVLTSVGVAGVVQFRDLLTGGSVEAVPGGSPTGEVVFNDRMSLYRPPAESLAADEASGRVFVADELLVMFTAEATDAQARAAITGWGGTAVGHLSAINRYEVLFGEPRTLAELHALAAELESDPLVDIAYVNDLAVSTADYEPDDSGWRSEWNGLAKNDGNWGMEAINAPALWDYRDQIVKGLGEVRIGVLDAGFVDNADVKVEVLSPNHGSDHGTHVSGTVGARFDNSDGVAGVVPVPEDSELTLYGVSEEGLSTNTAGALSEAVSEIYDGGGQCLSASVADLGLVYLVAERKSRVVNHSMGWLPVFDQAYAASRGNRAAMTSLSDFTRSQLHVLGRLLEGHDFLLVAAAGNERRDRTIWDNPDEGGVSIPLFVQDENAPYGYREARPYEAPWAHGGNLDAAVNSTFNFIGSAFDKRTDAADATLATQVRQHILVVGAAGLRDGSLYQAEFSNDGDRVDLYAPGVGIESTVGRDADDAHACGTVRCADMDGTSMAAPHVTGALAAVWAMKPGLTSTEVRSLVLDHLQPGDDICSDSCFLDVGAAAAALQDQLQADPVEPTDPTTPGPGSSGTAVTSLVFDTSGSMSDASGRTEEVTDSNGDSTTRDIAKIDAAKEAGQVLLTTIRSTAARYPGAFQVGVAEFSNYASDVITPTTDYDAVSAAINGLDASGGTDILEAIRIGTNQLSGLAGSRAVILLSDGKDEAGNSDEEILGAARSAADLGIKLCTVGFGEGGDLNEELLRQVAEATGCEYSRAEASSAVALAGSFISAQLQTQASLLAQQTGSVGQGQTTLAVPLAVPDRTGDLTTVLYWPGAQAQAAGSRLDAVLVDPEGVRVDASYPGVTVDERQVPSQLVITDPKPGDWSLSVYGRETGLAETQYFTVAAFEPIEREYAVNQIPRLTPDDAGPIPVVPGPAMVVTSVGLGAGLVLLLLGAAVALAPVGLTRASLSSSRPSTGGKSTASG
ncbi:MAG TPA: S8 family serine peptidase [Propionicimonas sp.]|nr:S8 family serine peptidase [Propionicimonas sp.]